MTATAQQQLEDAVRTVQDVPSGHVVSLARSFPAHPEELWAAVTIGGQLATWFGRASGEVVEGGDYALPDMDVTGRVLAVEAPRRLQLSWRAGRSRSEVELLLTPAEDGAGTRLELRHTVPADAYWEAFGPAATGCAWDAAFHGLALHLADPGTDQLPVLARFAGSPAGAEFTRASAEAWYEAHVAAGADRKPARKASVRTAAAYLDEETDLS